VDGWGGRGDDGGAMGEMDWMVVWCGWRASTAMAMAALGFAAAGARAREIG